MLRFKVRPDIIFRTTDGGPFLILFFKIHAYVKITEDGPILILGFKIHPEILFWNFKERIISSYTAFSDPLKNFIMVLQRVCRQNFYFGTM